MLPVGHSKAPLLLHGGSLDLLDHIRGAGDGPALDQSSAHLGSVPPARAGLVDTEGRSVPAGIYHKGSHSLLSLQAQRLERGVAEF